MHTINKDLKKFLEFHRTTNSIEKVEKSLLDDSEIQRVEIIILKYKSPEIEKDCVNRIIEYTRWPYKLNIFDNRGNGPNTSKIWNKLIKESTCDYVLLLDNDSFVQKGMKDTCWLTEMMKAFKIHKNVAWVGPVCGTNAVSTIQSMIPEDMEPITVSSHLSGYCFLIKKSIFEEIGYFDEDFGFYGEESDWIEKVFELNQYAGKDYKLVVATRAYVIHGHDNHGSISAQLADKEHEFDMGEDSRYSYLCWNKKKYDRLKSLGIEYKFPELNGYEE